MLMSIFEKIHLPIKFSGSTTESILILLYSVSLNERLNNGGFCAAHSSLSSVITVNGYTELSEYPILSRYLKRIYK